MTDRNQIHRQWAADKAEVEVRQAELKIQRETASRDEAANTAEAKNTKAAEAEVSSFLDRYNRPR